MRISVCDPRFSIVTGKKMYYVLVLLYKDIPNVAAEYVKALCWRI